MNNSDIFGKINRSSIFYQRYLRVAFETRVSEGLVVKHMGLQCQRQIEITIQLMTSRLRTTLLFKNLIVVLKLRIRKEF